MLLKMTLKSELERKRIDLELQERERRLQEQAQRIENLSTMVLYSAMDDREKCVKTVCQVAALCLYIWFKFCHLERLTT